MTLVKTAVTVLIIVGVSEVVKRSPSIGALILALPLTSVLVMTWMHLEGSSHEDIAVHSTSTFWYVLPTLPMFLILPIMLVHKWNYFLSMLACSVITAALFVLVDKSGVFKPPNPEEIEASSNTTSD